MSRSALSELASEIERCERCPRLVAWREQIGREKRRAYRGETYWARPVPGFGDARARIAIVGLAPGAHGANRTGRMFTGDRSGEFLYAALHRAELASRPESRHAEDGLELRDLFITAPCRCVPPQNRPKPAELEACRPWLERELALLPRTRVFLALGGTAYDAVRKLAGLRPKELPRFAHGAHAEIPHPTRAGLRARLVASYHVSQQNTQTGRLTPAMFDEVLVLAKALAELTPSRAASPARPSSPSR